jgi:hypothetical protein
MSISGLLAATMPAIDTTARSPLGSVLFNCQIVRHLRAAYSIVLAKIAKALDKIPAIAILEP